MHAGPVTNPAGKGSMKSKSELVINGHTVLGECVESLKEATAVLAEAGYELGECVLDCNAKGTIVYIETPVDLTKRPELALIRKMRTVGFSRKRRPSFKDEREGQTEPTWQWAYTGASKFERTTLASIAK